MIDCVVEVHVTGSQSKILHGYAVPTTVKGGFTSLSF